MKMMVGVARLVMLVAVLVGAMQLQAESASISEVGAWPNFYHSVDSVTAYPGYIRINGWMFDNNDKTTIQLTFGDKWVGLFYRADVTKAYSLPSGLNTGFDVYLPLKSGSYSGESIICHAWHGETPYRIFYINATIDKPTATFDRQGGTGGTGSTQVDYSTANPTITVPTKDGYAFEGYYTGENGTGTKYYNHNGTSAKNWAETGGKTLYANWIDPNAVTSWSALRAALEAGYSVKLANDVAQTAGTSQISLTTAGMNVSLDLNGYTVTCYNGSRLVDIYVQNGEGATFTLKDSIGIGVVKDGSYQNGGCVWIGPGNFFVMEGGTIYNCSGSDKSGAVYVNQGTFMMSGGTIDSCKNTSLGGGAVYVTADGTFTMNEGMITNCTASSSGGAVYSAGSVVMNGGTISGCKSNGTSRTAGNESGGGAFYINDGSLIVNGGLVENCSASAWGGVAFVRCGTVNFNGGTYDGNTAVNNGKIVQVDGQGGAANTKVTLNGGIFRNHGSTSSFPCPLRCSTGTLNIYGGVYDVQPSTIISKDTGTVSWGSSSETAVGSNWVVGKSVAKDSNNKLTAGTYTFDPAASEYSAAGVALAPGRFTQKTGDLAWQILSGTPAGDSVWTYVKDGVCTVYGTGATSNDKPLDAQWASVKDVRITDGVTGLGTYFFYKFHNLTNVTVAASCTSLGEGALFRCLSLEQVTFEGSSLPTLGENALPVRAAIKMEGDTPVVTMVPKVTVGGKEPTLKGSTNLTEWVSVEAGNEGDYHFFKYVIGD